MGRSDGVSVTGSVGPPAFSSFPKEVWEIRARLGGRRFLGDLTGLIIQALPSPWKHSSLQRRLSARSSRPSCPLGPLLGVTVLQCLVTSSTLAPPRGLLSAPQSHPKGTHKPGKCKAPTVLAQLAESTQSFWDLKFWTCGPCPSLACTVSRPSCGGPFKGCPQATDLRGLLLSCQLQPR